MGGGVGGQNSNSLFVNQLFGKRKHLPSGRNTALRGGWFPEGCTDEVEEAGRKESSSQGTDADQEG